MADFHITDWEIGRSNAYLRLAISTGSLDGLVNVDSQMAREIALDVLAHQAQYLLYQPPNGSMKERPKADHYPVEANSWRLEARRRRWPRPARERNRKLDNAVSELLEEHTAEQIARSLQRVEADRG